MTFDSKNWAVLPVPGTVLAAQNNPWGAISRLEKTQWKQSIGIVNNKATFRYSYDLDTFDPRYVLAYPEVIHGDKFGSLDSGAEGLPVRVKDIDKIYIDFDYSEKDNATAARNVAIETFFHSTKDITGPGHPSGKNNVVFELMVWVDKPDSRFGIVPGDSRGIVDVDGREYEVFTHDSKAYVAFVAVEPQNAGRICWSDFIGACEQFEDLRTISKNWFISAFEFGPEIWTGAGEFTVNKFDVEFGTHSDHHDPGSNAAMYKKIAMLHDRIADCYREMT